MNEGPASSPYVAVSAHGAEIVNVTNVSDIIHPIEATIAARAQVQYEAEVSTLRLQAQIEYQAMLSRNTLQV